MGTEKNDMKKRRGTSLPLLIGFVILGVVGYFAGPTIMKWGFYLQESIIVGAGYKGRDVPKGIVPDTSGDPNVGPGPRVSGPGAGGPGGPGAGTADAAPGDAAAAAPTEPPAAAN